MSKYFGQKKKLSNRKENFVQKKRADMEIFKLKEMN